MSTLRRSWRAFDGVEVERYEYQPHEDRLYRQTLQPDKPKILEFNQRLRLEPEATRDLSFGRRILQIPVVDLPALRAKYPELVSGDGRQRKLAWLRVAREHPEYRVTEAV